MAHIRPKGATRLLTLVRNQHGVVSYAQLREAGVGAGAIKRRVQSGRLRRVHRGVYAVGPLELSERGRWMAAVLVCGEGAVLSHLAAAALWGIVRGAPSRVDITIPSSAGRKQRRGIVLHRSALERSEVTIRDRIPVTTVARTLLDIAGHVTRRELERAIDEAERLRLLDLPSLHAVLRRRRGAAALRAVMKEHDPGSTLARSELEERFLALCDRHGLPRPKVNARIGKDTVDFLWPDARLVVETDGRASHLTSYAFEEDRKRDARLSLAGYRVVRFTRRRVEEEPREVARTVRVLQRRPDSELPTSRARSNSGSG